MGRETIDNKWAENGVKVPEPTPSKILIGWVAEIPPFEWWNWWWNRVDNMLERVETYGVQDWSAFTVYALGGLALGSDNLHYKAKVANQAIDPISNPTHWARFAFDIAFESAATSWTVDTAHVAAHGFTAVPRLFIASWVCTSAVDGYSIGDEVPFSVAVNATDVGATIHADATNLNLIVGSAGPTVIGVTSKNNLVIIPAEWDFILRAWE